MSRLIVSPTMTTKTTVVMIAQPMTRMTRMMTMTMTMTMTVEQTAVTCVLLVAHAVRNASLVL